MTGYYIATLLPVLWLPLSEGRVGVVGLQQRSDGGWDAEPRPVAPSQGQRSVGVVEVHH